MRKVLFLLCAAVFAVGGTATAMTPDEALALFQNDQVMVEYSDAGRAQLEEAIAALKVALGAPADLDETSEKAVGDLAIPIELKHVVNKLSQAYYTLANVFLVATEHETYVIYRHGKNWGFKSLRMNPEFNDLSGGRFDDSVARETDVTALYWTNANWLRESSESAATKLNAVFAGVKDKSIMLTNRILELAPEFIVGGAYRSFGAFYEQLPSLFGRDINKAIYYLCHVVNEPEICAKCGATLAIPDADEYFENRTFLVEYYLIPQKQWQEAIRVLEAVLAEPIGDKYPLMNAYAQARARELLAQCQEHL